MNKSHFQEYQIWRARACDVYSQENIFSRDLILNCFVYNAPCMILKGQLVDLIGLLDQHFYFIFFTTEPENPKLKSTLIFEICTCYVNFAVTKDYYNETDHIF